MLDLTKRLIVPSARSAVDPFMVMDVVAAAARLEAAGRRIVHMEIGQPSSPPPACAITAAAAAMTAGPVGYTEALGMPQLRARIARHYDTTYGVSVDPAQVVVTTGSSAGFMLAYLALMEAGERVAMAAPGYPPYRHVAKALGCVAVTIETSQRNRWAITPEALLAAHKATPLKALLIASPGNPTGTMMGEEALTKLIRTAEAAGIAVISDEVYHGLDYAVEAKTAAGISRHAIVINSFSKYFCMTGWRIGWMVVPGELVRTMERLQQNLSISVPTLSQVAAAAAFDGCAEMEAVKHSYEDNRRVLLEGLPKAGLDTMLPADGGFFMYVDVSRFTDDSYRFAQDMLDHAGVAATPGVDFDPAHGKKYMRFCYSGAKSDMIEAVERIAGWLEA